MVARAWPISSLVPRRTRWRTSMKSFGPPATTRSDTTAFFPAADSWAIPSDGPTASVARTIPPARNERLFIGFPLGSGGRTTARLFADATPVLNSGDRLAEAAVGTQSGYGSAGCPLPSRDRQGADERKPLPDGRGSDWRA